MPRNEGEGGHDRPVAAGGVNVGVAEPARLEADQNLTEPRTRYRSLPALKRLGKCGHNGCLHGMAPLGEGGPVPTSRDCVSVDKDSFLDLGSDGPRPEGPEVPSFAALRPDVGSLDLANQSPQ